MNQSTRMFKTLGFLVVAMTAASALLGWADPSVDQSEPELTAQQVLSRATSLVNKNVDIRFGHWLDIDILSGPPVQHSGRLLTASADTDQAHFYVDEMGHLYRGVMWRYQEASNEEPDSIRIRVSSPGEHQPMSAAQWTGLRALISSLNQSLSGSENSMPAYLEESWSNIYGLDAGTAIQVDPLITSPSSK